MLLSRLKEPPEPYNKVVNRVLSGDMKRELTNWWLSLIEESVKSFMKQSYPEFDPEALPENYIDTPPASLPAIQQNITILKRVLKEGEASLRAELAEPLRKEIYARIDDFEECLRAVLALRDFHCGGGNSNGDGGCGCGCCGELVCSEVEKENLMSDLEYMLKMRQLEDTVWSSLSSTNANNTPSPSSTPALAGVAVGVGVGVGSGAGAPTTAGGGVSPSLSQVVPINGLIIGVFRRLLNEHVTSLEHHSRSPNRNNP